jgi:type II secretory pathway component PulF
MNADEFLISTVIAAVIAVVAGLAGLGIVLLIRRAARGTKSPGWGLFGAILRAIAATVILLLMFVAFLGLLGPLGFVWWVILLFVVIESVRKRRASQQNALLWVLAVSAERQIPLGPAVEALAEERGGLFSRRARRLAKLLSMGAPLPDALDFCPGLLPAFSLPIIRIGSQSGALAAALRQAATVQNQHSVVWTSLVGKVSYLLVLPCLGVPVLIFIMIWIVPRLTKIFADFHVEMPAMTRSLIVVCYHVANYWFVALPLLLFIAALLVYAVMRYFGWTYRDPPGMSRLVRRLDTARILDGLAIVARQERPMIDGIAALAGSYPKPNIQALMSRALRDVESGGDWAEALCGRGLIRRTDYALLQAAQRVGNLPWAMQEMADSNRRRYIYRLQAIVQAAFPPMVIVCGLIVMFIAVAVFWPLVTLIQVLA